MIDYNNSMKVMFSILDKEFDLDYKEKSRMEKMFKAIQQREYIIKVSRKTDTEEKADEKFFKLDDDDESQSLKQQMSLNSVIKFFLEYIAEI